MFNRNTGIVLLIALAAGLGLLLAQKVFGPAQGSGPQARSILLYPTPRVLPDFNLSQSDGTRLLPGELRGHWTLVFLGFTSCPDVCPTTLTELAMAQKQWEAIPESLRPRVLFISVDPERDTPEQIKTYLSNEVFPKGTIGLTGTPEQVAAAAKAYRVYYKKNGEGSDYLVDHSTPAYLMNPKGQFDRVLPYGISPEETARQIADAMR